MNVADVMRRDLEFVSPEASVQEAAQLMGELDVSALPVGSREDLRGVLTGRDILIRVVAKGLDNTQLKAGEVMSSSLFACREEDSLQTALELMASHDVRRLPVLDARGRVTGWITLAHIAERLHLQGQLAQQVLASLASLPQ